MSFLRLNWPNDSIPPKLHMLEDHVIEFLTQWRAGLGFYGEQGGESIHAEISRMTNRYSSIRNPVDRLKYTMNQHLLTTFPKAQLLKPQIKRRKMAKKDIIT